MTAYVLAVLTLLPLAVLVWWVFPGPLASYRQRRLYGDHNPPPVLSGFLATNHTTQEEA